MVKRIGSNRRKSRHILMKSIRTKGKMSFSRFFAHFKEGDKVLLQVEPNYHKGSYHMRHHAKMGTIQGMQGACYKVQINDGGKQKSLLIHPVHLKKQ